MTNKDDTEETPNELEICLRKMYKKYLSRIQQKGQGGNCCNYKNYHIKKKYLIETKNTIIVA